MDGRNWGSPVAQGQGAGGRTVIALRPVPAKFVRITQTGAEANAPAWTMANLRLYEVK